MSGPLVSIIITYHNEGDALLHEAIASIEQQTYKGLLEIVVVDDASREPPSLPDKCRLPMRLVTSQRNIHLPAARNLGVSCCSGDFLAFLDADDVYLPYKIERELSALRGWNEAAMVGGQGFIHRDNCITLHVPPMVTIYFDTPLTAPTLLPEAARLDVCLKYLFHSCGFIVRRSAFESVGGFEPLYRWGEEWDLQIRLAQIGRIGYVPAPGYRYIQRAGSMTQVQNARKFESWAAICMRHRLDVTGLSNSHKRDLRATASHALLLAAQTHLEQDHNPISAWRCAWRSLGSKATIWGVRSLVRSTLHLLARTFAATLRRQPAS